MVNFPNIQEISVGGNHSLILLQNGELYGFGSNVFGQLGNDNLVTNKPSLILKDKSIKKIVCGGNHSIIYKEQEVLSFGNNGHGQLGLGDLKERNSPTLLMMDPNIKSICCGNDFTLILKQNGDLFSFGKNNSGEKIMF
eukprot:TRINITY_DN3252_c0_g2_i2.p1 TRINITY_DN3252_c0_g2~~TRINITY_DN3252_c0_g2_i2.p1  ORF type:complete len:139 (+),score=25.85 TRINITY_DN3252_c0_g2_i2:332-748(+)